MLETSTSPKNVGISGTKSTDENTKPSRSYLDILFFVLSLLGIIAIMGFFLFKLLEEDMVKKRKTN